MEERDFEPGSEDAGLEPLGRYRRSGMSSTMRDVFDVLYEADEPLDPKTIADRTFPRATGAAQFHSRRAVIRQRERQRTRKNQNVYIARSSGNVDVSVREAWPLWIRKLLNDGHTRGVVLRDERGRYQPNPAKPPTALHIDGTTYPYTREAWQETTQHERTVGELQTMRMEADRLLGNLTRDTLNMALEIAVRDFAGFTRKGGRPIDPRTVRTKLRWLLERPTTDESRAWLLHELTRRIYES